MTPTLVFDIETIPDAQGLRVLLDVSNDISDEDVVNLALHQRRQQNGTEFCRCIYTKFAPFLAHYAKQTTLASGRWVMKTLQKKK